MQHMMLAALGGAIGAGARQFVNVAMMSAYGAAFPWATLLVNVTGSLLMGLLVALLLDRLPDAAGLRVFLLTGILGGFTTFSAFSIDLISLVERGEAGAAALYAAASVALSVGACAAGLLLMRWALA